ncbi:MAG: protein kinase [Sedimentisphaerales bacterium]|nr:protein kinase [Sedimentisphaerales bacterium]
MDEEIDDHRDQRVSNAARQYAQAYLEGQAPDLDTFLRQFPGLEMDIRRKIESFQKIDSLFENLRHVDESDLATAENLVDTTVGHFRISEVIGHGGMGVVYKAHDSRLGRVVAIKTVPAHLRENRVIQERFRREAKMLAVLSHPHIGVIHDILDQADGATYLVLEYVPGQTLAERIRDGRLLVKETLSIALQIAEALAAAYEKGVVHRDLKPSNIKITPDGNVKVLDFGIAKTLAFAPTAGAGFVQEGQTTETIAPPGHLIGTPAYMSPEQARGKPTDHRTDVWSFGCVLYEMLTGTVAFDGETISDTIARVIERDPDWDRLPSDVPGNIRVLLRRCFEKDARDRLQHIGDAVIEIRETLNMPATAPPATSTSISLTPHIAAKVRSQRTAMTIAGIIIIALSAIAVWLILEHRTQPSSKEIRLVVLPFENLGSAEDEYFAAGITDSITARLATIGGLTVISRQSAMQYKKSKKTAQQIAHELRVDYLLEGTVQREKPSDPTSRVRIIPRLIKIADDSQVWAHIYDDDMSGVFRLQSDMAERMAQALDITLLEPERRALQSRPTKNMEAYDYYLRGDEYHQRSSLENDFKIAISMYERAVELDPEFALAYARLAKVHAWIYWFYYDRSEQRLAKAKQAVDKALQLEPDLPEAHLALGLYYYWGHLDYGRALDEFAIVAKSLPNNSELPEYTGYVQRRQGKFEQALKNLKKASELNPRSNIIAREVAQTFLVLRKYSQAESYYERAILLRPDSPISYSCMAWLYLFWEGNTDKARAVVDRALQNITSPEQSSIVDLRTTLDVYDGNYQQGLDRLSLRSIDIDNQEYIDDQYRFIPKSLRYAEIYGYINNNEMAKTHYEAARNILEARIQEQPEDARLHTSLGIAYAGLGRREEAIREGKAGVDLLPVTKEAWRGLYRVEYLARIFVMIGEYNMAIDQIEFLLSVPGELSVPLLRLDPVWTPLRDHPRFKKLLEAENLSSMLGEPQIARRVQA